MMAPPNALTDSNTWFLPKAQLYLISMTRTPKSKPYVTTLPKNNLSKHWWVVYATLLLCLSTACFITLLSYTQHFYLADLCPSLTLC